LNSLLLFGSVYEIYGETVRAPPGVFSKVASALELLAVLKLAPEEVLTMKCDVLLRACVLGAPSSSSRTEKKLAFEAVRGVLGVLDMS
jgi:hypothetical protein